jgi:hypothetical protein
VSATAGLPCSAVLTPPPPAAAGDYLLRLIAAPWEVPSFALAGDAGTGACTVFSASVGTQDRLVHELSTAPGERLALGERYKLHCTWPAGAQRPTFKLANSKEQAKSLHHH